MAVIFKQDAESEKKVRDAFTHFVQEQEERGGSRILCADWLETPVGCFLAAGDDDHLYIMLYSGKASLIRKIALLQKKIGACLTLGSSLTVASIRKELDVYFRGDLRTFATPVRLTGTDFQIRVWETLRQVPYGRTVAYAALAEKIEKPAAFRAVAQASAQTPLDIVIPCHRLTNTDGDAGGYSAEQKRKDWVLKMEKHYCTQPPR